MLWSCMSIYWYRKMLICKCLIFQNLNPCIQWSSILRVRENVKSHFQRLIDLGQESVHSTIHRWSNQWGCLYQDVVVCKIVTRIFIKDREEKLLKISAPCLLSWWTRLWELLSELLIELIFILSPKGFVIHCKTWTDCIAGGCPGNRGSQSEELEKSQRRRCGWNAKKIRKWKI